MVQMFRQDQPGFKFTDVMPNDRFDLISFAADKIHQLHQWEYKQNRRAWRLKNKVRLLIEKLSWPRISVRD